MSSCLACACPNRLSAHLYWQVGAVVLGTNAATCLSLLACASVLGWQMWAITLVCAGVSFVYNLWALVLRGRVVAADTPNEAAPRPLKELQLGGTCCGSVIQGGPACVNVAEQKVRPMGLVFQNPDSPAPL